MTEDQLLKEARRAIDEAIEQNGPYTHNLISIALRRVAAALGVEAANGLVDEFELTELFGITKR